ncbi:MAG: putative conserved domain protein, partial [uncultured Nocardioidaceae bacterium]
ARDPGHQVLDRTDRARQRRREDRHGGPGLPRRRDPAAAVHHREHRDARDERELRPGRGGRRHRRRGDGPLRQGQGEERTQRRHRRSHLAGGGAADLHLLRLGVRRRADRRGDGDRHGRARHVRPHHGPGHDPLGGAAGGRQGAPGGRTGAAPEVGRDGAGERHGPGLEGAGRGAPRAGHRGELCGVGRRTGDHRAGARGRPQRGACGRRQDRHAGREGAAGQGDRDRAADRLGRGPQGADRGRRRQRGPL